MQTLLESHIEAFNQSDVESLVNNISDDFKWYYVTSDTLLLEVEGKEAFRKSMESYYKYVGKVTSSVEDLVIQGNLISFKETVSYKNKEGKLVSASSMAVYQFKKNKISRAWYFIE